MSAPEDCNIGRGGVRVARPAHLVRRALAAPLKWRPVRVTVTVAVTVAVTVSHAPAWAPQGRAPGVSSAAGSNNAGHPAPITAPKARLEPRRGCDPPPANRLGAG